MRILWHRVIGVLLLAALLVVGVIVLVRFIDYRMAQREYEEYAAMQEASEAATISVPTPTAAWTETPAPTQYAVAIPANSATPVPTATTLPTAEPFYSERIQKLKKQNKDTIGFIEVPDTDVQYPVVQGKDNEYYMTHTFAKKRRAAGAIFLDAWNSAELTDFNSVIYGHNMKDGSMFALLREYRHPDFLRNHKYIEVTLLHSHKTYKVFSAYIAEEDVDFRGFGCDSAKEKAEFIKQITYRSEIDTNATATEDDHILTLVTCTSGERDRFWIVHAVLVEDVNTKQ